MFQDEKKHNWVPLDESVKCTMIWNMNKLPMLYIDVYTVLEEISNLEELRKGDHCLVPLNPIRKLLGSYFDSFIFLLGSLGILKLYHHFIVMSDVDRLDKNGVPLDKNGRPVTICEYSNLVSTAAAEVVRDGFVKFFSNCAPFHELPLHDVRIFQLRRRDDRTTTHNAYSTLQFVQTYITRKHTECFECSRDLVWSQKRTETKRSNDAGISRPITDLTILYIQIAKVLLFLWKAVEEVATKADLSHHK